MYLHTLLINGFKSFPEAKVQFPRGITAVVGPNGTGKSNIVDAILWVLGEQSTKTLRSERMEDVIFNGTEHRKPVGMTEVSLILGDVQKHELEALAGNEDGIGASSEIMITRRLYRDGESEYLINQVPVRLKDIRNLLWTARAGTKGHTVIEQGNLDQLLNASPQERREFVEATAGITKYKKQKAEALRKLDATEQNLLRVRDILAEVRRQLRSLERQARQAQEYQALKAEARSLELRLLLHEHRTLHDQQRSIQQELAAAEAQESATLAEETRCLAEQEQAKLSLSELSAQIHETQERRRHLDQALGQSLATLEIIRTRMSQGEQQHDQAVRERLRLTDELDQTEQAIHAITQRLEDIRRERDDLTRALEEAETQAGTLATQRSTASRELEQARHAAIATTVEKTNAENRRRSLEDQRQNLSKRIARLFAEQQACEARHAQLSSECTASRTQQRTCEQTLARLRENRQAARRRLAELEARLRAIEAEHVRHQTDLAGKESTLRALQAIVHETFGYSPAGEIDRDSLRGRLHAIQEAFGERLEVPPSMETAIEAVLGDRVQAWIVERSDDAARGVELLKSQQKGHGSFLILEAARCHPVQPHVPWWPAIQHDPDVIGRAVELVRAPEAWAHFHAAVFGHTVIVRSLSAAIRIMREHDWFHGDGPVLVTLDGETLHASGLLTHGISETAAGVLQRRREIDALREQIGELAQRIAEAQRTKQTVLDEITQLRDTEAALDSEIGALESRLVELQKEAAAHGQAILELSRRIESLEAERTSEHTEVERLSSELASVARTIDELRSQEAARENTVRSAKDRLQALDERARALTAQITDLRLALSAQDARWQHEHETRARLERDNIARRNQIASLDAQFEQLFLQSRENQEERTRTESRLEELEQQKREIEQELTALDRRHHEASSRVQELDRRLRDIRERVAAALKTRSAVEIRLAEVRTKLHTVETTLTETYDHSLSASESHDDGTGETPEAESEFATPDLWHEQLQTVRRKLERIGAVNLTAIDEHRELETRCQFLTDQETDLTTSIHSLQEIIQRLNQTTDRLFTETFHALQEKFNEVFTALFAGGRAELVLVAPEEEEAPRRSNREPGVEIIAQPPGKRLKNLAMLSGGEKTLTVLALLFASFLIKPSPFCILDEVDAPLDETNVARFSQFMRQMADRSQFIVITHNKRTMEAADSLFGVTMEEPGVSKLVSVRLAELERVA